MARTKAEALRAVQKAKKSKAASSNETKASDAEKAHRLKSGLGALREIRKYQGSTELLLHKHSFQRLVREMVQKLGPFRFEVQALVSLQEACEQYLVGLFEDAGHIALHGRRVTVMSRDLKFSKRIRHSKDDEAAVASTADKGELTPRGTARCARSSKRGSRNENVAERCGLQSIGELDRQGSSACRQL